jgi:hypothetical protein
MSDALKRITELARLMQTQEARVAAQKAALAMAEADLLRTKREDLPELMRECDLKNLTLTDGSVLELRDDVACSISDEQRPIAHQWLIDNGYDGIIKTELSIPFARGEHETAVQIAAEIAATYGRQTAVNETIHHQTLRAFVRERLEKGVAVPTKPFGIFPYSEAKLKAPKV